eukprot:c11443_g1_i1.p1 GENE.c11443_g1_i1~~c11443_g1_i1.p1  ORF type:complete len:179 (+),score=34.61 c11443_g1_i1:134-670(+)
MREINSDILEKRKYLIKVLQQFASVLHLSTSEVSKLQNREDLVTSEIANISRLRRELQSSSRALRNQPGIGVGLSSSESESGASGQDDEELSSDSEDDDEDQQEPQVNVTTESPKSRSSRLSRVLSAMRIVRRFQASAPLDSDTTMPTQPPPTTVKRSSTQTTALTKLRATFRGSNAK